MELFIVVFGALFSVMNPLSTVPDAILLSGVLIFLMLRGAHSIVRFLGASGINALSRIIGFIVIAIGIEFIISAG